jgi:hypothetical protein
MLVKYSSHFAAPGGVAALTCAAARRIRADAGAECYWTRGRRLGRSPPDGTIFRTNLCYELSLQPILRRSVLSVGCS